MTMKVRLYFCFYALLMAFASLFSGCSADDSTPSEAANEIRFNADVWRVMEGTRATTYDNQTDLQTESSFTCAVYNANSTTPYITSTTVNWVTSEWLFSDGKHYWPAEGSLDFFAYMPATPPSYISDITYSARNPQFSCTDLPISHSDQGSSLKEFVYTLVTDQNKNTTDTYGNLGVTLSFQHPFARIKFAWSGGSAPVGMTLNSVTFKNIKREGTYTHSEGWSPSGDNVNFSSTVIDGSTWYLVIPQAWAGDIEVNASWIDWGESLPHTVTASVPTNWEAGYSYTYTFTITETDLKVDTQKYTEQW